MMWNSKLAASQNHGEAARPVRRQVSPVLVNLLRDTSAPILVFLSEQYGLRRVPGLDKSGLIERLLRHLPDEGLEELENRLIAARYGGLAVDDLLALALQIDERQQHRTGRPRIEDVDPQAVTLVEGSALRWHYSVHGYDVVIDRGRHYLGCSCQYFAFSSHRRALCKHLAATFRLIPEAYAREVLIDLLVSRQYGAPGPRRWRFESFKAA
jgi:hypothetical protein